jgi:heme iron utilization protein
MDADTRQRLRRLLHEVPVAALATLHQGEPALSMVPVAWLEASAVIHVSRLATHTADLLAEPAVSLLWIAEPDANTSPLARPRASLRGRARVCPPADPRYAGARTAYLARFPDGAPMFEFGDFSLVLVDGRALRFVAGFGQAHSLTADALATLLAA